MGYFFRGNEMWLFTLPKTFFFAEKILLYIHYPIKWMQIVTQCCKCPTLGLTNGTIHATFWTKSPDSVANFQEPIWSLQKIVIILSYRTFPYLISNNCIRMIIFLNTVNEKFVRILKQSNIKFSRNVPHWILQLFLS